MRSGRRRSFVSALLPLLLPLLPVAWGDCGPLPDISHAEPPEDTKHRGNFTVGSKVRYTCLTGFVKRPLMSDTIQCLENSQWSNLPEFCGRSCPSPPHVPFAKLAQEHEMQNFYPVAVTVKYICRPGYESFMDQLPTSTCLENLTWSEVPELCRRKSCGIPANPEHGEVVTNDYLIGARATVVCNHGYTLKGASPLISCTLRQGEVAWSQVPACQAISCPPPPAIPNGQHNGNGTEEFTYNSVVMYTCDPGLQLVGNETLLCTTENSVDGVWSRSPPQCRVSATPAINQTEAPEDRRPNNLCWLCGIILICIVVILGVILITGVIAIAVHNNRRKDNKNPSDHVCPICEAWLRAHDDQHGTCHEAPPEEQQDRGSDNACLPMCNRKRRALPMHPITTDDGKQPKWWYSYFCRTPSCHVSPKSQEWLHTTLAPHAVPRHRGCAICERWLRAQPGMLYTYRVPSIKETHSPAKKSPRGSICPCCADQLHLSHVRSDTSRCPVRPLAGEGTLVHLVDQRTPGCHVCPICAAPTHAHLCQPWHPTVGTWPPKAPPGGHHGWKGQDTRSTCIF